MHIVLRQIAGLRHLFDQLGSHVLSINFLFDNHEEPFSSALHLPQATDGALFLRVGAFD